MSGFAIALVLSAAVLHAIWNYLAKRCYGGIPFVWLISLSACVVYTPLTVVLLLTTPIPFGAAQLLAILGSALLQLVYFLSLTRGYQVADLSLVYPLARGTGPLLATVAAILLLGERPSTLALGGAALIAVGIFVLAGDPRKLRQAGATQGVVFALITGIAIASYTLWDKQAVAHYLIPPLLLNWSIAGIHTLVLLPLARRRWQAVRLEWRDHWRLVLGVSILSPLAYILVLTALTFSPVSYVAPMRESSVLIGTLIGARLLSEGQSRRRVAGAAIIVAGVIAIGLG
ncbi:MAG: EamA family transporter [Anaerolineae bacterium]|nr:EamA family transporter [Anaerolineae bacterium]